MFVFKIINWISVTDIQVVKSQIDLMQGSSYKLEFLFIVFFYVN